MQCFSCRLWGAPMSWIYPDGRREMVSPCCRETTGEVGAVPDVAQWLRTRSIKVAWLIRAKRGAA